MVRVHAPARRTARPGRTSTSGAWATSGLTWSPTTTPASSHRGPTDRLIGSRVAASATGEISAQSFFLDPASGNETAIDGGAWRPVVDPTDKWAVTWDGTMKIGPDGITPVPDEGALVLRGFADACRRDH